MNATCGFVEPFSDAHVRFQCGKNGFLRFKQSIYIDWNEEPFLKRQCEKPLMFASSFWCEHFQFSRVLFRNWLAWFCYSTQFWNLNSDFTWRNRIPKLRMWFLMSCSGLERINHDRSKKGYTIRIIRNFKKKVEKRMPASHPTKQIINEKKTIGFGFQQRLHTESWEVLMILNESHHSLTKRNKFHSYRQKGVVAQT